MGGPLFLLLSLIIAANVGAETLPENPRMTRFNETFTRTGEIRDCIHLSRVRSSRVLDGEHILFRMHGNRYYLNTLPRRCPRLGVIRSFAFSTSIAKLCSLDTIVAFDDFEHATHFRSHTRLGLLSGPRCGLGSFEQVEKRDEETNRASVDEAPA